MKAIKITFFGDSICTGEGVALHSGWVARLSRHFEEAGVIVANSSLNGDTTRLALLRMPYHIMSQPSNIVVIQFGMNDCNRWQTEGDIYRVSPEAFKANIKEMLTRVRSCGIGYAIVNTNHPSQSPRDGYDMDNRRYNQLIRSAVAEHDPYNVLLLDIERAVEQGILTADSILLEDGIHLNRTGHDFYYNAMKPALEKMVAELNRRS